MTETIIVAVISLFGTLIGTFTGIVTSGKMTTYRIEQLEKKVEKLNNLVERVYQLEGKDQQEDSRRTCKQNRNYRQDYEESNQEGSYCSEGRKAS